MNDDTAAFIVGFFITNLKVFFHSITNYFCTFFKTKSVFKLFLFSTALYKLGLSRFYVIVDSLLAYGTDQSDFSRGLLSWVPACLCQFYR